MEKTINIHVIEENRSAISEYGKVFGKAVFTPTKEGIILNFGQRSQQAAENNGLFLNRQINRCKVAPVNITSLSVETDIDGESVVVINKGLTDAAGNSTEVRCPMSSPKFTKEATDDNLRDSFEAKTRAYFSSGKKVRDAVNRINMKELEKVEGLISELEKVANNLRTTITNNDVLIENYYKQLDNKGAEVHVSVDID